MTEQGIVKKIEGDLVWISAEQCATCAHSSAGCGACDSPDGGAAGRASLSRGAAASASTGHQELTLFGSRRERSFAVRNSRSLALRPGDRVEYYVAPGKAIKAGFLVLILPLLIFFLLYFLSGRLWPEARESVRVLIGVGGIAAGMLVNLARKKRREYPEIVRVIPDRIF